jgi:uridine kinase
LIGIAGETASGKSTFCAQIVDRAPAGSLRVLSLDSYYRSQDHLPSRKREEVNYDHPEAFDLALLLEHIDELCQGRSIHMPVYDFGSHERLAKTIEVSWAPIIIIEGILALYWEELRRRYDVTVYVDAPENLRLERRIARDTAHRGRTRQSVIDQWESSVQPMSRAFCAPTREFADLIVNGENQDLAALEHLLDGLIT